MPAYVPGHPHDLFLSYARDEAEWVKAFSSGIEKQLYTALGRRAEFWQDTKNLRLGENWVERIHDAIDNAAAFIAVCSPLYFAPGVNASKRAPAPSRFAPRNAF